MSEKAKGQKDIMNEVKEFEKQFRDPNRPGLLHLHLTPEEILGKLGFKRVEYCDLDQRLKEGLEKNNAKTFKPSPIDANHNVDPSVVIMQNNDGSVIYFFQGSFGEYTMSRGKRTNGAYLVHELNTDLGVTEILDSVSFYEIKQSQTPKNFTTFEGLDIRIPLADVSAAEEIRNQLRTI
jgi:hypothetical protein